MTTTTDACVFDVKKDTQEANITDVSFATQEANTIRCMFLDGKLLNTKEHKTRTVSNSLHAGGTGGRTVLQRKFWEKTH